MKNQKVYLKKRTLFLKKSGIDYLVEIQLIMLIQFNRLWMGVILLQAKHSKMLC